MATISVTIPDAIMTRVLDGMVPVQQLDAQGDPIPKGQTAKAMIVDYIKTCVKNTEGDIARAAAQAAADVTVT